MKSLIEYVNDKTSYKDTNFYSQMTGMSEDSIICALSYKFAKGLPYSMDIQQMEYVLGDFINMRPYDCKDSKFFKYNDNVYQAMISWNDTFKSGILLQMCVVFQKMLSFEIPNNYNLDEEDFYTLGISRMTSNIEYNKNFFEILKMLPQYYEEVQNTTSVEERRKVLEKIFDQMKMAISNRVGGFRQTEVKDGKQVVIRESKPTIVWSPVKDLEMLYEFQHVRIDGDVSLIIKNIKEEKLQMFNEVIEVTNDNDSKFLVKNQGNK